SRKQDRILVFFVGHLVEIGDEGYLVPIEGELDNPATLIPLKWFYAQLAKCKARQKVLIVDGNRFNPSQGLERPASGPTGPMPPAQLAKPPAGVQVWSSCSAGQQSLVTDDAPVGLFLDTLREALAPLRGKGALEGTIQRPGDLIPVEKLRDWVDKRLA